jgi:hypothetical protein
MIANTLSACIATDKVGQSRDFYVKHFGAKVTFDCGWYVESLSISTPTGNRLRNGSSPQQAAGNLRP